MKRFLRVASATALLVPLALVGCAPASSVEIPSDAVIIDVRTPAEFSEGHLEGAINIDVQAADFDARIAELDPAEDYLVYCRSGNRSAAAIDRMEDAGFTDLYNGGGLQAAASATGLSIVDP